MKPKQKSASGITGLTVACDLETLKGIRVALNPKQKSVTMWAMYQNNKFMKWLGVYRSRDQVWKAFCFMKNASQSHIKEFKECGYRAVKGKFVWEEK